MGRRSQVIAVNFRRLTIYDEREKNETALLEASIFRHFARGGNLFMHAIFSGAGTRS